MISFQEAFSIIQHHIPDNKPISCSLQEAAGLTLAEDIYAITDIPAFEQSSMDGYAVFFDDISSGPLAIKGEMAAGAKEQIVMGRNEAVRIFTGAPLPKGADTVIMQEKVSIENGLLSSADDQLQRGDNVRYKGAEIKAGALAVKAGSFLSPAAIGFVAGIGITEAMVFPVPAVSIIVTGRELQQPGKPLEFGQVYESNSQSLQAALRQADIRDISVTSADDDPAELQNVLSEALKQSDVILLTGGVSVGDYDFVLQAVEACGINQQFHKVKQKPGKPLYFGTKGSQLIFGLPGNPSSVLTCFYQYVLPALEAITHKTNSVKKLVAELSHDYIKGTGLTHFLKGYYDAGKVTALTAQESFRLSSFVQANCFIFLEEERYDYKSGEIVQIYVLPV